VQGRYRKSSLPDGEIRIMLLNKSESAISWIEIFILLTQKVFTS